MIHRPVPRTMLLLMALGVAGCGTPPAHPAVAPGAWLESIGFGARAAWPSAALHRSREQIDAWPRSLSRWIEAEVPEVRAALPGQEWGLFRRQPDAQLGCELPVFLNGSRVQRRRSAAGTLDHLVPRGELDGLEVHLGDEGPVADPCGAILLWSFARAETGDPRFHGRVVGEITGPRADTVIAVRIEPSDEHLILAGGSRFTSDSLLPGLYQVVYLTAAGPLNRRDARVFAHHDTRVGLEVAAIRSYQRERPLPRRQARARRRLGGKHGASGAALGGGKGRVNPRPLSPARPHSARCATRRRPPAATAACSSRRAPAARRRSWRS